MKQKNQNPQELQPVNQNSVINKSLTIKGESYIIFEGKIDPQATLRLVNAILGYQKMSLKKINIFFSSLGGSIYEGFLVASVIQNSKIPVSVHATNHIDSIANVIYLSAKERTSESHAKFYMHGASTQGNFDEKALIDELSAIKTNNTRIANYISENSKISLKRVQAMMSTGTTISAQQALKENIVQNITHREIPVDAIREEIIYVN